MTSSSELTGLLTPLRRPRSQTLEVVAAVSAGDVSTLRKIFIKEDSHSSSILAGVGAAVLTSIISNNIVQLNKKNQQKHGCEHCIWNKEMITALKASEFIWFIRCFGGMRMIFFLYLLVYYLNSSWKSVFGLWLIIFLRVIYTDQWRYRCQHDYIDKFWRCCLFFNLFLKISIENDQNMAIREIDSLEVLKIFFYLHCMCHNKTDFSRGLM